MLTPLKAIRAKCMDCTNNQFIEVRECCIKDCALYPYRMGHNPNRAGLGNKNFNKSGEEIIEENNSDSESFVESNKKM